MTTEEQGNQQSCPVCGEGGLHARETWQRVEHAGQETDLPVRYSVCDACGSEVTGREDARANKRAMLAFRKRAEGLLSGEEIRAFRKRYRMSQQKAAELLGGGKIAFSRYEADDIAQSEAMDSLLRLCRDEPANLLRLARYKGAELPDGMDSHIRHLAAEALMARLAPRIRRTFDARLPSRKPGTGGAPKVIEFRRWKQQAA
jgi:HTH-type transcriptional regulator/antitoxin MqsA